VNTLEEQVLWSFDYFSKKTENYKNYTYKLGKGEDLILFKFTNFLRTEYGELSIGKNWLYDYFCFHFEYWRTKNIKYFKGGGIIELSWVIGPKAVLRWKSRLSSYSYFYKEGVIKIFKISSEDYFSNFIEQKQTIISRGELERSRFFNTDMGFLHCVQTTSGYNTKYQKCKICKFRLKCKTIEL